VSICGSGKRWWLWIKCENRGTRSKKLKLNEILNLNPVWHETNTNENPSPYLFT